MAAMSDLRSRRPPPKYLGRDFQFRMLGLVAALAMMLMLIELARRPQSWYWLTGVPETEPTEPTEPTDGERPSVAVVVPPATAVTPPGTVVIVPLADPTPGDAEAGVLIEPGRLQGVRDDSRGLRAEEIDLYHWVLGHARTQRQSELEDASRGDVAFAVLQTQPVRFRGRLITLNGDLRRLLPFQVRENEYGVEKLYEALIYTADSGTTPYRVRFTTEPVDLPRGKMLDPPIPVRVTGYFFKRDQYLAGENLERIHAAPLVLAQRIDRRGDGVVASATVSQAGRMPLIAGIVGIAAVIVVVMVVYGWRSRRIDRAFARGPLRTLTAPTPEDLAALDGLETIDVEEVFRRLSVEAEERDGSGG